MVSDPATPIGSAARENQKLRAAFERLHLDYCCHGARTIQQACQAAGVHVAEVAAAIALMESDPTAAAPEPNWDRMSMSDLCDDIEETHHRFARTLFERLAVLLERVVAAHSTSHPELPHLARLVAYLREDMVDHLVREERVLFPWLRRLEQRGSTTATPWTVRRQIESMMHDHDSVASSFATIRELTRHYTPPPDACASYVAAYAALAELEVDTRLHIHKENNILFPKGVLAEASLTIAAASESEPQSRLADRLASRSI